MGIKITKIGITSDKISARGGLPLFLRYIERIGLCTLISGNVLSLVTKNGKGLQLQGFQPLHICWGPFLIDVLFRKGSAHSNHGTDYPDRVKAVVKLIRKRYSKDVPIIICADSGFAD